MQTNEQRLRNAQRNARRKVGFFIHGAVFLLVNLVLFTINVWSGNSLTWAVFPFLGWGTSILIHGVAVFGPLGHLYQWLVHRELAREAESCADGRGS